MVIKHDLTGRNDLPREFFEEHDLMDANPVDIRMFHDEVVSIGNGVLLGKSYYPLGGNLIFLSYLFLMTTP